MANPETLAFLKALQQHYSEDGTVLSITSNVTEATPSDGAYRSLIKALLNDKQTLVKELQVSNNILKNANLYHLVLVER